MPIPEELLEQVERGNVLLFIGERIIRDAQGRAAIDGLTAQLTTRCGFPDDEGLTFPEAAQIYEHTLGRHALLQLVRDELAAFGEEPQPVHDLIAELSECKVVATTCLDRCLERAIRDRKRPLNVVIRNEDIAFADERAVQLYKLRGSVEQPESLLLTSDQYEAFDQQATTSLVLLVLQSYLARKTIVFLGYDLADSHFRRLYRKTIDPLDTYARRSYTLFAAPPSPSVSLWCERRGIQVLQTEAVEFLETLLAQQAARPQPTPTGVPVPSAPLPKRPYKFLDYYEARDTAIFFGRESETLELTSLIHVHRLTLLYGASGTGKTSLLLAGAMPRLEGADPPYETIYVRALEDPALVIRRMVQRKLPQVDLPQNSALVDFLHAATKALDRTLVIVLDQFEEFFIRLGPEFRAAFVAELGALYDAREVPVKVVLSLREDWLAAVGEIEERIPEVFRTRMRLLPLAREQASQAIVEPVETLGMSYDSGLVDRVLDDLAGAQGTSVTREGAIAPPQLQLVCDALYRHARDDGRQVITSVDYEAVGSAQGVLRRYLKGELARLRSEEQELARAALAELVTSQGTKAVKTAEVLALALDVGRSELEPVMEKLVRARLLRAVEWEREDTGYELAHEHLIAEIALSPEAVARKEAEELLRQGVENRQRFGVLLPAEAFALIDAQRGRLRLDIMAQELMLRGALQAGHEVEYWLDRVSNLECRMAVLTETSRSRQSQVRQRAAKALGAQGVSDAVEPLLDLAVRDPNLSVRVAARHSLAKLAEQCPIVVARLRSEMEYADRETNRSALETLAVLPLRGLPVELYIQALTTRIMVWIRPLVPWFIGWTLASTVGGFLGLLLGAAVSGALGVAESKASGGVGYNTVFEGGIVFGIVCGSVVGIAQWIVLRKRASRSAWWILASAVGWAMGLIACKALGEIIGTAVYGAVFGTVTGTTQWIVLRSRVHRSGWWILASAVGWIVAYATYQAAMTMFETLYVPVFSIVSGAITGLALGWLWEYSGSSKTADRIR